MNKESVTKSKVLEVLNNIPRAFRTALELSDLHQLTLEEIADVEQVSINTARLRIILGRKLLKQGLMKKADNSESEDDEKSTKQIQPDPEIRELLLPIIADIVPMEGFDQFYDKYQDQLKKQTSLQRPYNFFSIQIRKFFNDHFSFIKTPIPVLAMGVCLVITCLVVVVVYQMAFNSNTNFVAINNPIKEPSPAVTPTHEATPKPDPPVPIPDQTLKPTIKPDKIKKPIHTYPYNNKAENSSEDPGRIRGSNQIKSVNSIKKLYVANLLSEFINDDNRNLLIESLSATGRFNIENKIDKADAMITYKSDSKNILILITRDSKILWQYKITGLLEEKNIQTMVNEISKIAQDLEAKAATQTLQNK